MMMLCWAQCIFFLLPFTSTSSCIHPTNRKPSEMQVCFLPRNLIGGLQGPTILIMFFTTSYTRVVQKRLTNIHEIPTNPNQSILGPLGSPSSAVHNNQSADFVFFQSSFGVVLELGNLPKMTGVWIWSTVAIRGKSTMNEDVFFLL